MGEYNGELRNDANTSKLRPTDARQPARGGVPLQQGHTSMMQPGVSNQMFNYVVEEHVACDAEAKAAHAAEAKAEISEEFPVSFHQPPARRTRTRAHT